MIRSILQKLFPSKIKKDPTIPTNNTITFWIGDDGLPYVKIYIVDTTDNSIQPLAELLFGINSGEYMSYMLSLLIDMSKQDLSINKYIKETLANWQNLTSHGVMIDPNSDPYVKPTTFNKKHND